MYKLITSAYLKHNQKNESHQGINFFQFGISLWLKNIFLSLICLTCLIGWICINCIIARKSIIASAREGRVISARRINRQTWSIVTIVSANILVKIGHSRWIASVNYLVAWSVHIIAFVWIGVPVGAGLNCSWAVPIVQGCRAK